MNRIDIMIKQVISYRFGKQARLLALAALFLAPVWAWGQTDYSGTYYIGVYGKNSSSQYTPDNPNNTNNFYLCPTEDWLYYVATNNCQHTPDNGQPFITSYKCKGHNDYDLTKAVWVITKQSNSNYYYIQQGRSGKYLVFNGQIGNGGENRIRVHLETIEAPTQLDDNALFAITLATSGNYSGYWLFHPKNASDGYYLNITEGNHDYLIGTNAKTDGPTVDGYPQSKNVGGTIGQWSQANNTSSFYLEPVVLPPTITFNNATNQVTITAADGVSIYYTTNGDTPTSSLESHTSPVTFTPTSSCTIQAIAVKSWTNPVFEVSSEITTLELQKVATPVIANVNNAISITTDTEGATIYYATGSSDLVVGESPEYTDPLHDYSGVDIKAIAVKENMINSDIAGPTTITLQCAAPVIRNDEEGFKIICNFPSSGVTIYYEIADGHDTPGTPTTSSSSSTFSGDHVDLPAGHSLPVTITAIAVAENYNNSELTTTYLEALQELDGSGTSADPYLIASQANVIPFVDLANSEGGGSAYYKVTATESLNFSVAASITRPFTGHFDGNLVVLSGLEHPLMDVCNGATIKNVILDNVNISSGENVGAICGKALGASRIYNCGVLAIGSIVNTDENGYTFLTDCSSTISGSGSVGGLVGLLDGESRVINCFSYAKVSGGSFVGGIVGYNNVATTAVNLKTMVMNCMFYGEVSGDSIAPIYNGNIITNVGQNTGVSNFNYFRLESAYIQDNAKAKAYNCALGAETRFLQRFEFYRHLLNSNRALAAWWATGSRDNKDEMMKWVMEPSQIGTSTPYPILKTPGRYPSVLNYEPSNELIDANNEPRNEGRKLGTLAVHIRMGAGGAVFEPALNASITTTDTTLIVTDKDPAHFNFNYGKVQLPYYNQVGTNNYRKVSNASNATSRVVTGWKIVSITGGTAGTYSTGEDVTYDGSGNLTATPYNFADRNCTNKDLYSVSGRVFSQGAYWDVPYGVSAITIEPYWAKCVYLADAYSDVVYDQNMSTAYNVPNVGGGQQYTNRDSYPIAGESQRVFTSKGDAIATSNYGLFQNETGSGDRTVYDYAVVLVGNYHYYGSLDADMSKPYTVTSIDLDGDNEPDYSYILRFDSRKAVHPVRVDFINIPGLGMAQKSTGGTGSYNFGIMQPKGWFESTNTSLFRETQFEYDNSARIAAPYILQGGVMEQWVNGQSGGHANLTTYFHVGGNVWFKEFHRGTHQDQQYDANHSPVSVTGGDFDQFHLTGLYRSDATIRDDNAECYITGGRFGMVAGTGMDGIGHPTNHTNGNITWIIDNADIKEFYAGSFNADKPAQGNLLTIVNGGHIDLFCGGPKFGDMNLGRTVITTATGCTFGTFFGAGYGGNSYGRQAPFNHNNIINFPHSTTQAGNHASWNAWVNEFYTQEYNETYGGVSTQFNYQFLPMSSNVDNVARLFVEYVKFSLATTHSVTSTLTDCTILNNFYGGGNLGKVDGQVSSVLESCTVKGNVYGAGYSASLPTVEVDSIGGFRVEPYYYKDLGTYRIGVKGQTTTYTWEHGSSIDVDNDNHILYTTVNLDKSELGSVKGNVTLTIKGNSTVLGNVFGGGDESYVTQQTGHESTTGNTTVILQEGTKVLGSVYGGGNEGPVGGNSEVIVQDSPNISGTTPFTESTQVTITGPGDDEIYYTTDGSTPTAESMPYHGAFPLTETTTVKAIVITNGVISPVATKTFTKQ